MNVKINKLILFFAVVCFIFILNIIQANSQEINSLSGLPPYLIDSQENNYNKDNLKIGFRTSAKLFGKVRYQSGYNFEPEGYCIELGKKISERINKNPVFHPIANDNAGDEFLRYEGLRKNLIDIECGANTIFQPEDAVEKWQEGIIFSTGFYNTGIKFLLHKNIFDRLNNNFWAELNNIKIEVVKNTTTFNVLNHNNIYRNHIHFYDEENSAVSLYEALQTLDSDDNLYVYASDLPILKTLLQQAYSGGEYKIFPEEDNEYLPIIGSTETYGISLYSESNNIENRFGFSVNYLKDIISDVVRDLKTNSNFNSSSQENSIIDVDAIPADNYIFEFTGCSVSGDVIFPFECRFAVENIDPNRRELVVEPMESRVVTNDGITIKDLSIEIDGEKSSEQPYSIELIKGSPLTGIVRFKTEPDIQIRLLDLGFRSDDSQLKVPFQF